MFKQKAMRTTRQGGRVGGHEGKKAKENEARTNKIEEQSIQERGRQQ